MDARLHVEDFGKFLRVIAGHHNLVALYLVKYLFR